MENFGTIYKLISEEIVPNVYPGTFYNGRYLSNYERQFVGNMDGLRLGPLFMRQKRVKRGKLLVRYHYDLETSISYHINACNSLRGGTHVQRGTSACPRFCKRRVLFCTQVRSMGVKIPLQSTKYMQV